MTTENTFGFEFGLEIPAIDNSHCARFCLRVETPSPASVEEQLDELMSDDIPPPRVPTVVWDDDSEVGYYLHALTIMHGAIVSTPALMEVAEPLRSAVLRWTRLDETETDYAEDSFAMIDPELGLLVTYSQGSPAFGVHWIAPESVEKAREHVRELKRGGKWKVPNISLR